jgi:hypothetical protein
MSFIRSIKQILKDSEPSPEVSEEYQSNMDELEVIHKDFYYDFDDDLDNEDEISSESPQESKQTGEQAVKSRLDVNIIKIMQTISIAGEMLKIFKTIFSPSEVPESEIKEEVNAELHENAINLITGQGDSAKLMERASELIGDAKSNHSALKSSEHSTIQELMLRAAMQNRPQYFDPLERGEPQEEETSFAIANNFFKEFVQDGALDVWLKFFQEKIKDPAILEAINAAARWFKTLVLNPQHDSLNKYVDPKELKAAIQMREWLKENQEDPEYDDVHHQFLELDERIEANRMQALQEFGEYLFSLLKRMQPEFAAMINPEEFTAHLSQKNVAEKRLEFEKFILEGYKRIDLFESNAIRSFWEKLYRHEYGKLCYKIVCESFSQEYKDSEVHQAVQRIWAVSHLDTIHEAPREAKSRMPGRSVDGYPAPNFGYKMAESAAYKKWLENPLARNMADVVMDSYHAVIDFGLALDTDVFLERLKLHFSESKEDMWLRIQVQDPHEYDAFLIAFECYLLAKVFDKPFMRGEDRTIPGELIKAAVTQGNLLAKAREVLTEFKRFATNMADLRPSDAKLSKEDELRGLVFGIGFNGELFDSPDFNSDKRHEILLTFSNSGRTLGGYLTLAFLKHIASVPWLNKLRWEFAKNATIAEENFNKYKRLISYHLNRQIKEEYQRPDFHYNTSRLSDIKKRRAQLEEFMAQLDKDEILFSQLTPNFKEWIKDTKNWYWIPHSNKEDILRPAESISIEIPEEMPPEEYEAQQLARILVFDALTSPSFSREHAYLMPMLFIHWKEVLLRVLTNEKSAAISGIKQARELHELSPTHKTIAINALNKLVTKVHADIPLSWSRVITKEFNKFMHNDVKAAERNLEAARNSVKKTKKNLENAKAKNSSNIDKVIELNKQAQESLQKAEEEKATLPKTPSALSEQKYKEFRKQFFAERDVEQCVEPVFARVLGHDRFFSVFISKKVNRTDILNPSSSDPRPLQLGNRIPQDAIAPCDKRCQHHVLGQLYTGDMLSHQSADRLDNMRRIHGLGEVPDRFMTFPHYDASSSSSKDSSGVSSKGATSLAESYTSLDDLEIKTSIQQKVRKDKKEEKKKSESAPTTTIPPNAKYLLHNGKLAPFIKKSIAGNGNCMFDTIAQGVEKYLNPAIATEIRTQVRQKCNLIEELKNLDDKLLRHVIVKKLNEQALDEKLAENLVNHGLITLLTLEEGQHEGVLKIIRTHDRTKLLEGRFENARDTYRKTGVSNNTKNWAELYRDLIALPGMWGGPTELYRLEELCDIRLDMRQQLNLGNRSKERQLKKLQHYIEEEKKKEEKHYTNHVKTILTKALTFAATLSEQEARQQFGSQVMALITPVFPRIKSEDGIDQAKLEAYIESTEAIELYYQWFVIRKVWGSDELERSIYYQCLVDKYSTRGLTLEMLDCMHTLGIKVEDVYLPHDEHDRVQRLQEIDENRRLCVIYTGDHYDLVETLPTCKPIVLVPDQASEVLVGATSSSSCSSSTSSPPTPNGKSINSYSKIQLILEPRKSSKRKDELKEAKGIRSSVSVLTAQQGSSTSTSKAKITSSRQLKTSSLVAQWHNVKMHKVKKHETRKCDLVPRDAIGLRIK